MTINHRSHRSVFAGVLGAIAFAGGLAAVSINASADAPALVAPYDEAPTTTIAEVDTAPADLGSISIEEMSAEEEAWMAFDDCMNDAGVYDHVGYDELDEEDYEAMDAAYDAAYDECSLLLPEEIRVENAAWDAFNECIDEVLGPEFYEGENWDDQAYTEADLACRSVLPEHIQQEMAAHDAFSACQNEFVGEPAYNGHVSIDRLDAYDSFAFGDGDASITITKVDGEVTVSVDGDVIVQDDDYWEAQEEQWMAADEACSHLLPSYD